ncbi:MAG: deoxyribodipyrimidine photolyase, partial [Planctomycetota bacterium]|nr:deoxyribodipyrimidine photolyase [Planctomycetota bacterium]
MTEINPCRISVANTKDLNTNGDFVLYWMTAFRRTKWNFALQRAAQLADELHKPLVIFEPLRINYRWASQRFHQFVIQGMKCNRDRLSESQVTYIPYVEPKRNASAGLLDQLSHRACCVVSDDYPCFFLPSLVRKATRLIPCRFELVDSNCIIPIRLAERTFTVAHSYRRWMQKNIKEHLEEMPETNPLFQKKLPRLPKNLLSG